MLTATSAAGRVMTCCPGRPRNLRPGSRRRRWPIIAKLADLGRTRSVESGTMRATERADAIAAAGSGSASLATTSAEAKYGQRVRRWCGAACCSRCHGAAEAVPTIANHDTHGRPEPLPLKRRRAQTVGNRRRISIGVSLSRRKEAIAVMMGRWCGGGSSLRVSTACHRWHESAARSTRHRACID